MAIARLGNMNGAGCNKARDSVWPGQVVNEKTFDTSSIDLSSSIDDRFI